MTTLGKLRKTIKYDGYELRFYERPSDMRPESITVITIMYISKTGNVCFDIPLANEMGYGDKVFILKNGIDYLIETAEEDIKHSKTWVKNMNTLNN